MAQQQTDTLKRNIDAALEILAGMATVEDDEEYRGKLYEIQNVLMEGISEKFLADRSAVALCACIVNAELLEAAKAVLEAGYRLAGPKWAKPLQTRIANAVGKAEGVSATD